MNKVFIPFRVDTLSITKTTNRQVPTDNQNYIYAQFNFNSSWDRLNKTAIFSKKDTVTMHQPIIDDICQIPNNFLTEVGTIEVSVYAGDRRTVNMATVEVIESGFKDGIPPLPPEETYSYILTPNEHSVTVIQNVDGEFQGLVGGEFVAFGNDSGGGESRPTNITSTTLEIGGNAYNRTVNIKPADVLKINKVPTIDADLTSHINDNIRHITNAERINWNNKSTFSGNFNDLTEKPNVNQPFLIDAFFSIISNTATLSFNVTNPVTGVNNVLTRAVPIATDLVTGLMPKESVVALAKVIDTVGKLQGGMEYLPVIQLHNEDVTQTALTNWAIQQGYTPPFISGITIPDLDNHEWVWNATMNEWVDIGVWGFEIATIDRLGVVMSADIDGKIYVEVDGTMSLVGWDYLVEQTSNAMLLAENALPKTSISAWALATTKPTYDISEITNGASKYFVNEAIREAILDSWETEY